MADFSLMWPSDCPRNFKELGEDCCNDLSLEFLCASLSPKEYDRNVIAAMLRQMPAEPQVVQYRVDVFDDILRHPGLRQNMAALLDQLEFLKSLHKHARDSEATSIWQIINRLNELDSYIDCVTGIKQILESNEIHSEGLKALLGLVRHIDSDSGFPALKEDIKRVVSETGQIKSVTLGVNLNRTLAPVEVGVVSINNAPYTRAGVLSHFYEFAASKDGLHDGTDVTSMKYHVPNTSTGIIGVPKQSGARGALTGLAKVYTLSDAETNPLMNNLNAVITDMLKPVVRKLNDVLAKYVDVSGYSLISLIPELTFYLRWAELTEQMMAAGIPMCKPEVLAAERRQFYADGLYNLKLGLKKLKGEALDIVPNTVDFRAERRIYIMTGPNRGGKTTFTQAIGLIFLLAQHGLYVPATRCMLSPADCIYTHFPADENRTVDLGRLGEESRRISDIFSEATDRSLLLFNESLATTNFEEGLYIAKDVVKALHLLGARTIFNTHMHDLAMNLDELNRSMPGDSAVASLITGIDNGQRSYKVSLAPPCGQSYARDIAKQYGVTYAQLKARVEQNRSHHASN
ncbi:MAG: DNA mismatch repair protein [Clostridia bacterium]|nr:DNA mismatch repair protein [Clostridia bacterium]